MDRHVFKGLIAAMPLIVPIGLLSHDWSLGVTFLAIAIVGAFGGTVMMRSADAAERRERERERRG